jgi:hypothetical protein
VRLVLDTNAAVSGLRWHGNPGKLIDAAHAGSVTLYASALLLAELRGVLGREKFARHLQTRGLNAMQMFEGYAALTTVVAPAFISPVIQSYHTPRSHLGRHSIRCGHAANGRRLLRPLRARSRCRVDKHHSQSRAPPRPRHAR